MFITSCSANPPSRSSKYPSLNPILAEDTTILRFDLKEKPSQSIIASTYYAHRPSHVFIKPTQRMRLISKSFPWTIDIDSNAPITVGDVWDAMHVALQQHIVESEWGFICRDEKLKKTVENAMKARIASDPMADKRPKRIDLLGDATLFRGLEKDDDYTKAMLLPTAKAWSETWVIKLIA